MSWIACCYKEHPFSIVSQRTLNFQQGFKHLVELNNGDKSVSTPYFICRTQRKDEFSLQLSKIKYNMGDKEIPLLGVFPFHNWDATANVTPVLGRKVPHKVALFTHYLESICVFMVETEGRALLWLDLHQDLTEEQVEEMGALYSLFADRIYIIGNSTRINEGVMYTMPGYIRGIRTNFVLLKDVQEFCENRESRFKTSAHPHIAIVDLHNSPSQINSDDFQEFIGKPIVEGKDLAPEGGLHIYTNLAFTPSAINHQQLKDRGIVIRTWDFQETPQIYLNYANRLILPQVNAYPTTNRWRVLAHSAGIPVYPSEEGPLTTNAYCLEYSLNKVIQWMAH